MKIRHTVLWFILFSFALTLVAAPSFAAEHPKTLVSEDYFVKAQDPCQGRSKCMVRRFVASEK